MDKTSKQHPEKEFDGNMDRPTTRNIARFLSEELMPEDVQNVAKANQKRLGKYIIVETLGKGGTGVVFKAFDTKLQTHVTLKLLESISEESKRRFEREARVVAGLQHPNIVPIYEIGEVEGRHYISMKYIEGHTLGTCIGQLDIRRYCEIMRDVCSAVQAAHDSGVIHRDIKPENIMIDKRGWVYVLDFGLARQHASDLTFTKEVIGTPHYMSPEQIECRVLDQRSDIYSVGVTLYHCLTDKLPFNGESTMEVIRAVIESEPVNIRKHVPSLNKDLNSIVMKCMVKDPGLRYQNISELKKDLDNFLERSPVSARHNRLVPTKTVVLSVCVLLCLGIATIVYLKFWPGKGGLNEAILSYEKGLSILNIIKKSPASETRLKFKQILKDAYDLFSKSISLERGYAKAFLARGEVELFRQNYIEAFNDFSSAVEASPELNEAYFKRILSVYGIHGVYFFPQSAEEGEELDLYIDRAKDDLKKMVKLGISVARIKCAEAVIRMFENYSGGVIYNSNDFIRLLQESIEADPTLYISHFLLAKIYKVRFEMSVDPDMKSRFSQLCFQHNSRALEIEPNHQINYVLAIDVSRKLGLTENARKYLKYLREFDGNNPHFVLMASLIELDSNNSDELKMLLDETYEKEFYQFKYDIDRILFYFQRGTVNLKISRVNEAEEDFNSAIDSAPDNKKDAVREMVERVKSEYRSK